MYKNLMDLHTHTDNSPDGKHNATLMCECAIRAGLKAIAITDHCECDAYTRDNYDMSVSQSLFETVKVKEIFRGQILVLAGIELGQPLHNKQAAEAELAKPYDFILNSIHNLRFMPDFYYLNYSLPENEPYDLLKKYFEELLETAQAGMFDSLAHLTYPLRYIKNIVIDLSRFSEIIDEILVSVANQGKAIEINTSGLRQGGEIIPGLEIVRRFKHVGGRYVTLGSDAHNAYDVGKNIADGMELAKAAGFDRVTLFQNREPLEINIK